MTVRSAARGAADTHSKANFDGMHGVVGRRSHPHRHGEGFEFTARRRDIPRGLVHRVGQRGPLPDPGPGQLVGQPRRAGGPHLRGGRRQAVATQHFRGVPRGQGGRCGVRFARPGRQGSQHGDDVPGMGQRPRRGHRGADGHPADGDRGAPGRVVERVAVAVDEPARLRGRRHNDRPDVVQGRRKRPVDVVIVGSGAGQQNRRDTAKIDRHQMIVPRSSTRRRGDPAPRGISEPRGLPWRWIG